MEWKKDGTAAVVLMTNGENRHNQVFVDEWNRVLDEVEADAAVKSLAIFSNHEKYWSLGLDLEWIGDRLAQKDLGSLKKFLYDMSSLFKRLLTFPVPVIAGLGGHAAANGLVLACACDFRFMRADRGFARFPEVDVGIPFLPGMIAMAHKAMPPQLFDEMQYTGRTFTGPQLEARGAVLKTFDGPEAFAQGVMEFARSFDKGREIFAEMKKRTNRAIIRMIEEEDPGYIEASAKSFGG